VTGVELLRAPFFHTPSNPFRDERALVCHEDGGLLIRDGRIVASGDFATVRDAHPDATVLDWRGGFVLPGFVDTHVHFPQLRILGGLGRTLLDWLEHVALPEEARMADVAYATGTAQRFVRALASHGTTTALVFGSHFSPATAALFDAAEAAGIRLISGLVVSDRYLRPELHQSPDDAHRDSSELVRRYHGRGRLLYAVTPRFALSASEPMLEMCQSLLSEHDGLRVQTHINESLGEIAEVPKLFPWSADYLEVYERFGLTGARTVLAHDVFPTDSELARLAAGGTSIAHCPSSNAALGNGIFPLRRHVEAGVRVALGTDVGGGTGFGMLKEGLQAHLMQRVAEPSGLNLDPARLCYLVTKAGAEAVGLADEIGDLQPGKAADLVYVRPPADSSLAEVLSRSQSMVESLAAIFTLAGPESVREVRVAGQPVKRTAEPLAAPPPAR
jgi:guanine deaminase